MHNNYLMNNYGARNLSLVKGEGSWVWDDQGNRYLDAVMGIAVCGLGHSNPEITDVIAEQAATLTHCSNLFMIPQQQELAEKLATTASMQSVFFSNSGAEANEAAIKLARFYGHRQGVDVPTILVTEGCFHGRTMATLSATFGEKVRAGFSPLVESFVHIPYNDLGAVKAQASNSSIVAVMVEPVQGEAGINIPDAEYLKNLRRVCDDNNWLLILDEIQTGNGRTGSHFACVGQSVVPDILTTAKGLGNGIPIGACLAAGVAAELFAPGSHGSTYGGNPLVCAVANKVFDIITRDNLAARAEALGKTLSKALKTRLQAVPKVKEVRNSGLMIAVELADNCPEIVERAREEGLIVNVTAGNKIRLLPALTMTDEEAGILVDKLCLIVEQWQLQNG